MGIDVDISADIKYVGVNDHDIDLFEGQYVVPRGMAYNSYVVLGGEKTAVMDTVDGRFYDAWAANIAGVLGGKSPDYLVVQHMEPDHSACVAKFLAANPTTVVVSSAPAFRMMKNFFGDDFADRRLVVKEGDALDLGVHKLAFVAAPMVHWPEVIVTYDAAEKTLFSADGFGKFGANDVEDPEGWDCEARRYYIGIVGKYGPQVQALLKKAAGLAIEKILPLHGPLLTTAEEVGHAVQQYDTWSSYRVESPGVCIAYTSVYGHTKAAALKLKELLEAKGCPKVAIADLARDDMPETVEDAFRYGKLVLATTTYNADIFPFMRTFISHLTERNYQNRVVGLIENGSWAPMAAQVMKGLFAKSKDITFCDNVVTVVSALDAASEAKLAALADELMASDGRRVHPRAARNGFSKGERTMKLLKSLFAACLFVGVAGAETLTSPDGRVAVTVDVKPDLTWRVMRKGAEILRPSALGLQFKGQKPFGEMEVVKATPRTIDQVWTNRLYKKEVVLDRANELVFDLREKAAPNRRLGLVFRAYDGAVAFRYEIPAQPGFELFTLTKECTQWCFPGDPLAWLTVYGAGGGRPSYKTSQEEAFKRRAIRSVTAGQLVGMPALVEVEGQLVALCEADLTDWAGLFFRVPGDESQPPDATVLTADLSPIPDCGDDRVIACAPRHSPWRVMILGDSELDLLANNDVILNLNPPPEGGDAAFDWVKPGATSWDWWYESNNSLSTDLTIELIDFAAEMGWPYHTIDGGWYGYARRPNHGPGVKIFPRKEFDLDRILAHAKVKGVGVWVWCYWSALEENGVDAVFTDFERRGIKGVKIDFMDRQDQWMVRWYEKVIRSAAKHKLMINFHGAYKPTGMNRTWPNQITREGIRGNEMTKFYPYVTPVHTATLPFTRFLLGPGDYTPGSFGNVHSERFVAQSRKGHRYGDETDVRRIGAEEIGTRAHALALCIAYDSPLMTLCDWPQRYRGAKGLEALRALPTVWRNTLPLAGKIGHYYGVVRETYDGRLYLAILGVKGASFDLPLTFLPEGSAWTAKFYVDGPNAATDATDLAESTRTVTRTDKIKLSVAREGGAVVVFTRNANP